MVLLLPFGVGGWRGVPWLPLDGGAVSQRLTEGVGKHIPSNKEESAPLWDVLIHILEIRAECAC